MKKLLLPLLLAGTGALFAAKPVVQYDFNGKTGLPAKALKGKAEFVQGIRGQALKLADATLAIPAPKKVTPAEGTVAFWMKPVNWDSTKDEFVFFLRSDSKEKNGRFIFYKYSGKTGLGTTFYFGNPNGKHGKDYCYAATRRKDEMKQGEWIFAAATWSKKANLIRVYLNGKEVSSYECKAPMFFSSFGDFILNPRPFGKPNRSYETAFDLLRFYSEPLSEADLKKIYDEESKPVLELPIESSKPTFLTVPVMKTAPKIDGNFVDSEWLSAAKMGGFIELRNPRLQIDPDTEAYMGTDKKNLYFCFVGKIPGATTLKNIQTKRDSDVYTDDAYEIYLRPPHMKMGFYQGIFNYGGAIFDTCNSSKDWNGKWIIKNGIYEGHWICEISIPLSEMKTPFKENSLWKFNICRDRQLEPDIIFSSVSPSGMPYRAWFADFRLSEQGAFGRLTLNYERLFERKLDFDLEIMNQSGKQKNVTLDIRFINPDGKETAVKQMKALVPGKKAHTFKVSDPLSGFRAGIIRLNAVSDNGERIFAQDIPLVFKDEVATVMETDLAKGKLSFEVDLKSHYKLAGTNQVKVSIKAKDGKTLTVFAAGRPVAKGAFDLNKLTPGDCTITFTFLNRNGQELLSVDQYYNHIGQPKWLKEKPGKNAGVIYPYTPIKRKGNILSVIGRDHTFGKTLLPEQITSQGVKLFTKAPVLRGKVNGKSVVFDNFKFKTVKAADDAVTMEFTASAGGLELNGTMYMEFDGFLWYTVKSGKNAIRLDELFLEMEMPASVAEFYNGHFFSRENYVGKIKTPLAVRQIPSLWVGNMDVGLTFVAESFEYWNNADTLTANRYFKRGNNIVWQIRFIDKPINLAKKGLALEFGIEANPVKPIPNDFRSWRVHAHKPANICHPSQVSKEIRKYPGYNGGFTPEFKSLEAFKQEVKRFRDKGVEMSLYINPTLTSPDTTEYKIFRQQWRNPYNVYPQCPASTLADLTIWQIDYLIREGGLKVVYIDSLGAVNCANPLHGCGYIDETGAQKLTFPIRATREYVKRLYALIHAPGTSPKTNFLWGHMSARTCAPINAFMDFQCSGEELETVIAGNQNYLELYGLDEFQCYYLNSSGVMPMLLPNLGRVGSKEARWMPKYNDQLLALVLLHDTMLWVCWCDTDYILKHYKILDDFGLKDEKIEFLSYRKQKAVVSHDKDIFVSLYKLNNKAMAVIVNKQNIERNVRVNIDWKKLGIKPGAVLKDMRTGKALPKGGSATVRIPGYNFALIQIGE